MVWFILGGMYAPLTWHRTTMRIRQIAALTAETIVSPIDCNNPVRVAGSIPESVRACPVSRLRFRRLEAGDGCCDSRVSSALKLALNCLTRQ